MDSKRNLLSLRRRDVGTDEVLQHQAKKEAFWKESRQKAIIEKDMISRQTTIVLENFKARLLNTSRSLIESNNAFSKFLEDFDKREKKLQEVWVAINRYNPLLESNFIREQKQLLCYTGKRTHQWNVDDEVILPVDLACQLGNILNSKLQHQQQQHSPPKRFSPLHQPESRVLSPEIDLIQMPASQRDLQSDPLVDHKTVMYLFHIFGLIYSRIMDEVDLAEQQSKTIEQIFTDVGVRQPELVASPYPYHEDCKNGEQDEEALSSISSKVKLIIQSIETKIGSKEKVKKKTLADIPVNSMASSPRLTLASADESKPYSYHEGGGAVVNRKRPRKIPVQSSQDKENAFPLFADSASMSVDRRPLSSPPMTPTTVVSATATTYSESKPKSAAKKPKDPTSSSMITTKKVLIWKNTTPMTKEGMYIVQSGEESRSATGESQPQFTKDSIRRIEQENEAMREELIFLHMECELLRERNEILADTSEQLQEFRLQQQHKARALRQDLLAAKRYIRQLEERMKERDSEILSARKSISDSAFGCMDDIYQVDDVFESYSIPRDRLRNANALIAYSKNNLFPSPVKYCEYDGEGCDGANEAVCSPTPEKEEVARQLLEVINVAELQLVEIANQQSAIQILASENEILRSECAATSQQLVALESESEELNQQIFEVLRIAEDQAEKLRVIENGPTVFTVADSDIQYLPDRFSSSVGGDVAADSSAANRLTSNLCVECAMMSSFRIAHLESEKDRLQQQILEVLQIAEFQAEKLRSLQYNSSPLSSAISSCSASSLVIRSDDGGDDDIEVMIGNSDSESDTDTDGVFTALFNDSMDRSEWGEVPIQPDLNASRFSMTAAFIATHSPVRISLGQPSHLEGQRCLNQEHMDYLLLLFESSLRNVLLRCDIGEVDTTDEINVFRCKLQEILSLPCRSEENTMITTLSTLSYPNPSSTTDTKELRATMALLGTKMMNLRSILNAFQLDFESSNGLLSCSSPIELSENEDSDLGRSEILAIMSEVKGTLTAKLTSFQGLKASYTALQQEKVMMNKKLSLVAASVVAERDMFASQVSSAQNLQEEMRGAYESRQKSLDAELQAANDRLLSFINEKEMYEQSMQQEIDALNLELTSTALLRAAFQREAEAQRERCENISREYATYTLSLQEEIKLLKEELEFTSLASERVVYALKAEKKVLQDKTARMAYSRQEERAQLLAALIEEKGKSAVLLESCKKDVFEARQAYDSLTQYILNSQIADLKACIETTHSETSQEVNSLRIEADQLKELLTTTKATSMHTIDILKREISSWREQLANSTQESSKIIGVLKEEARKVKLQKETMIEESTAIISNLQRELTELMEGIYTLKKDTEAEIVVLKEKRTSHDLHKVQMISALEEEKKKVKQEMEEEQKHFVVAVALLQEEVHQLHLVNEVGERGVELRRRLHELQDDVRRWRLGLGGSSDSAVASAVEVMKATHKELEEYKSSLESTRRQLKSVGLAFDEKVALCNLQSERIAMQEADIETMKEKIAALAVANSSELSILLEQIAALERDLEVQRKQETERYNTYAGEFALELNAQQKLAEEKLLAAHESYVCRVQESSPPNPRIDELEKAIGALSDEYASFRKRAEELDSEQVERIAHQAQEIEQLRLDYSSITRKYAKQTSALQEVVERLNAREEELSKITVQYTTSKEPHRAAVTRPQYDIRKLQANVEARPALPTPAFIRNKEKPSSPGNGGAEEDSPDHSFS